MKRFHRDLRLAIIVAALSFGGCWLLGKSMFGYNDHIHNPHQWLHEQLDLTPEQDLKFLPIEQKFISKKQQMEQLIHEANHELAAAINEDSHYSARVKQAVDKIHMAQGELQKVTLEHLFDMHNVLNQEQRKKLNELATDALTHNP